MGLCSCGCVEAIDVAPAGVVKEIGLGAADEVPELVVPARLALSHRFCGATEVLTL